MRKIIQISTSGVENNFGTQCNYIVSALCDDGSVWVGSDNPYNAWVKLPDIPQEDAFIDISLSEIPNEELPGMWDKSDFESGNTDR